MPFQRDLTGVCWWLVEIELRGLICRASAYD
jgi:hypothetical protein